MKTKNRLRILGSDEQINEVKAFLDSLVEENKQEVDLKVFDINQKVLIDNIHFLHDTYIFDSELDIIRVIQRLSIKYHRVKFSYQTTTKDQSNKVIENHSYLLKDGIMLAETSYKPQNDRVQMPHHMMSVQEDQYEKKNEPEKQEDLFKLKEDFLMDTQMFVRSISRPLFKLWF